MDENRLLNLEQQVANQGKLLADVRESQLQRDKLLQEVRDSQVKIANALLGSLDSTSVGLIEQARASRAELNEVKERVELHNVKLEDLGEFKRDIKKVVAGIAFLVPVIFEVLKTLVETVWSHVDKVTPVVPHVVP
jgi:hypothetical protein